MCSRSNHGQWEPTGRRRPKCCTLSPWPLWFGTQIAWAYENTKIQRSKQWIVHEQTCAFVAIDAGVMAAQPAVGHAARVLGFCDQHGVAGSRVTRSAWQRHDGCGHRRWMWRRRDVRKRSVAIGTATARDLLLHAGEIFQSTRWRFFVSFFPVFALILFRSSLCCFLFPRFCVARVEVCWSLRSILGRTFGLKPERDIL